jgi:hypothetical protein
MCVHRHHGMHLCIATKPGLQAQRGAMHGSWVHLLKRESLCWKMLTVRGDCHCFAVEGTWKQMPCVAC